MKVALKFAQLHNGLFLAGKNHKDKLYSESVAMVFDTEEKILCVLYNKEVALIPESNVSSMTPQKSEDFFQIFKGYKTDVAPKTHTSHAQKLDIKGAQVSDPSTTVQNPPKKQ